MDYSTMYKSMCIQAYELQEIWIPTNGDFYWDGKYNELEVIRYENQKESPDDDYGYWWLPRLDQYINLSAMTWQNFIFHIAQEPFRLETTVERAGLKYLMMKKYNKEWGGDHWIISNNEKDRA